MAGQLEVDTQPGVVGGDGRSVKSRGSLDEDEVLEQSLARFISPEETREFLAARCRRSEARP